MTGQEIGEGRGGEILSLPLYTVLYNVKEGISRNKVIEVHIEFYIS